MQLTIDAIRPGRKVPRAADEARGTMFAQRSAYPFGRRGYFINSSCGRNSPE